MLRTSEGHVTMDNFAKHCKLHPACPTFAIFLCSPIQCQYAFITLNFKHRMFAKIPREVAKNILHGCNLFPSRRQTRKIYLLIRIRIYHMICESCYFLSADGQQVAQHYTRNHNEAEESSSNDKH